MPKVKLPKLTEAQVKSLASSQSYQRGVSYYHNESITNPVRQGMELRAECEGSDYEPYEVTATLNKNGVAETDCTCPYDYGGICKHIVALLLTYVHEPDSFEVLDDLQTDLSKLSKEELIQLVGDLVTREPKLKSVVNLSQAAPRGDKAMNVSAYRTQAKRAMASESHNTMRRELKALRETAQRMAKAGDLLNAGAIYHAALDEATKGYDNVAWEIDYDGYICIEIDGLAEGLGKCLKESTADADTRWQWIQALLQAEYKDHELGGVSFAPSAGDALLKFTNEEEWQKIETAIRAKIHRGSSWEQESWVYFLSERRKKQSSKDDLIRELGSPQQQAELLIRKRKFDEAMPVLRGAVAGLPGLLKQFADSLLAAGAAPQALQLVEENTSDPRNRSTAYEWLVNYYEKHGALEELVDAQLQLFLIYPNFEAYKKLAEKSRQLGNWNPMRAAAMKAVEANKNHFLLMDILLYEGNLKEALELWPKAQWGWSVNYELKLAQACEQEMPKKALEIYQKIVEREINARNRENYKQAAQYLKKVRKLFETLEAQEEWRMYLAGLRTKYSSLRALKEELERAKI
ncbi:MAG TPA: SWIM zinc finger family protein [Blastocatellia bacterium]|nr:SWIM zinc finger family protein [Blastocatellia bacterium]